ncbi:hypothetical protein FACS1894201_01500 [Bacteroidia bacterium]|nr:hypothetical protein FACS1894201_01500 [Bacteroidia bacterium]
MDIIKDPRFIDKVGNVFTEIGCINKSEEANRIVRTSFASETEKAVALGTLFRDATYDGWDKPNYYQYLEGIHRINQTLTPEKQISVYFTGENFDWANPITIEEYNKLDTLWFYTDDDSLMAAHFDLNFQKIQTQPRKKALVIWNYPHALNLQTSQKTAYKHTYAKYGDRLCNVMLNSMRMNAGHRPVVDGKWDAAFKVVNNPSVGFLFKNSPFGQNIFDLYYSNAKLPHIDSLNITYADVLTGFAYYKSPLDFVCVLGFPKAMPKDSMLIKEIYRRDYIISPQARDVSEEDGLKVVSEALHKYFIWNCANSEDENGNKIDNFEDVHAEKFNNIVNQWLSPKK